MVNQLDEELIKVTVNLFKADIDWLHTHTKGHNQSDDIRAAVRYYVQAMKGFEDD